MKRRLVLAIAVIAAAAVATFALPLAVVVERSYRDEHRLRFNATRSPDPRDRPQRRT